MWILFAAAAPGTRSIRFGPEVSGVILEDPTLIAQQAATLDELTGGRAEIVFSIGNFALLAQYGIEWQGTKPLARLREAHEVMRRFLADGSIDFEGDYYRYSGLFTAARPVQRPFPLKMGAMKGPGSFRVAGGIADGLHVACAHSREALAFAADNVREGAARAGRSLDDGFDLCASVLGAISEDRRPRRRPPGSRPPSTSPRCRPSWSSATGSSTRRSRPIVEAFVRGRRRAGARPDDRRGRRAAVDRRHSGGVGRPHPLRCRSGGLRPHGARPGRPEPDRVLVRHASRGSPRPPRPVGALCHSGWPRR